MATTDPKSPVAAILMKLKAKDGGGSSAGPGDEPDDGSDDGQQGMLSAAQDLITAVHAGDAQGVVDALTSAVQMVDDQGGGDEEEGEGEGETSSAPPGSEG